MRACACDLRDLFILVHSQTDRANYLAVVFQRFISRGFLAIRCQGQASYLEEFRRCKEHHVCREAQDRVGNAPFVEHPIGQAPSLCLDCRSQPCGPGAYYCDVEFFHFYFYVS